MDEQPVTELTGDALREWMNAAPVAQCDRCLRKTWSEVDDGRPCLMPQPSGERCRGEFRVLYS